MKLWAVLAMMLIGCGPTASPRAECIDACADQYCGVAPGCDVGYEACRAECGKLPQDEEQ